VSVLLHGMIILYQKDIRNLQAQLSAILIALVVKIYSVPDNNNIKFKTISDELQLWDFEISEVSIIVLSAFGMQRGLLLDWKRIFHCIKSAKRVEIGG